MLSNILTKRHYHQIVKLLCHVKCLAHLRHGCTVFTWIIYDVYLLQRHHRGEYAGLLNLDVDHFILVFTNV